MKNMAGKALVVIVAKEPVPGMVKTRLSPKLSPADAAGLYRCFLLDRIREIGTLTEVDLGIAYTPEEARGTFLALALDDFVLFPQRGTDLGQRLNNIFLDHFARRYDAVAVIDSDSPDLPKGLIRESVQMLLSKQTDVVFGPCHDGGYYLVGMRNAHPELFHDIPWSTPGVLSASLKKSRTLGLKVKLLTFWNDLDTFEDLVEFYDKYKNSSVLDREPAAETLAFLSRLENLIQIRQKS